MWERAPVAAALAGILGGIDAAVKAYATPPETFNPPAYIVWFVRSADYYVAAMNVDAIELPVRCCAGPMDVDRADALRIEARDAIAADTTQLGGTVQSCKVRGEVNWGRLQVAGAEVLAVDLLLDIRK